MANAFTQTHADRIETPGATYQYRAALPKPCVHPLYTPGGQSISGFEMSDHVWHRGLWFTIKFVNGANYWEENAPFGVQQSAAEPVCTFLACGGVQVVHRLNWTSDATGLAIRELRTVTFHPAANGVSLIDWTTELLAAQDLVLDRTPYTTWGGYGGLAFRAARELHDVSFLLPNGETPAALAGQRHEWTVMQAAVDGGPGRRVSIGMIDHPSNPRSPSPWYNKSNAGFSYANPAFLFHEPMKVAREQALKLRYRVAVRDGTWTRDEFARLADHFRNGTPA